MSVFAILLAGFTASIIDSFLGATVQAQYLDTQNNKITEKPLNQSGKNNSLVSGFAFINNDWVNFLSILTAPLFYFLFMLFLS